jgi:hypothetical protein
MKSNDGQVIFVRNVIDSPRISVIPIIDVAMDSVAAQGHRCEIVPGLFGQAQILNNITPNRSIGLCSVPLCN